MDTACFRKLDGIWGAILKDDGIEKLRSFSGDRGGFENARGIRLGMHFFNSNYILVRNLDAHVLFFSALGEAIFEENGFARIRG
jgi:hypothetical protein